MNPDRQQAIGYLRSPANGLWRWAENGAVLVWRDGATIAFREEILRVLEWLAPNGLPSFGAIALLLAACRGKVPVVAEILRDRLGILAGRCQWVKDDVKRDWLLKRVADLWPALKA